LDLVIHIKLCVVFFDFLNLKMLELTFHNLVLACCERIDEVVEDLATEYTPSEDDFFGKSNDTNSPKTDNSRSIFDDVDL
jgi:hypothetical protein